MGLVGDHHRVQHDAIPFDDALTDLDERSGLGCAANSEIIGGFFRNILKGDEAYSRAIGRIFLGPFGLDGSDRFVTHDIETRDKALARNPRTDESDYPLDVGRRTRKIPPALKRALILRDGGRCRFPGCSTHVFVDAHHLKHWADGGATCLDNLILLCNRHHTWTHEGRGRVVPDPDGGVIFINAFGERLPEIPRAREAA